MPSQEKAIIELLKKIAPSSMYSGGLKEFEGRMFIPSTHVIRDRIKDVDELLKNATHEEKKFLDNVRASLEFEEPAYGPSAVLEVFYLHLVKQAPKEAFLKIAEQAIETLDSYWDRLATKKWDLPLKIEVESECDSAKMIIEIVEKEHDLDFTGLKEKLSEYKEVFHSDVAGNFEELYPKLDGVTITCRKKIYTELIKRFYDYKESPEEIEKKAKEWLEKELPRMEQLRQRLADIYGCSADKVNEELQKRHKISKEDIVPLIKRIRKPLQTMVNRRLVEIYEPYDTRVVITPPYLQPFIPTAAMQSFDRLTEKPFNIFFSTPSEFQNFVDLFMSIIHEEYGHCVNFSNSTKDRKSALHIIDSSFDVPITEGIAFNREAEALDILREISDTVLEEDEREIRKIIEEHTDVKTFLFEYEYVMLEWRIMRFLRAMYDVQTNMGHEIKKFIEDAHKKTGLPKKRIFNQTFRLHTPPGYIPAYSIVGQRIRELQGLCREKGKDVRKFNTLACSMGFPARSTWEERLMKWINSG